MEIFLGCVLVVKTKKKCLDLISIGPWMLYFLVVLAKNLSLFSAPIEKWY